MKSNSPANQYEPLGCSDDLGFRRQLLKKQPLFMDADCGFEGRLKNVRDGFAGSRLRDSAGGEHIGSGVSLIDFIPGARFKDRQNLARLVRCESSIEVNGPASVSAFW